MYLRGGGRYIHVHVHVYTPVWNIADGNAVSSPFVCVCVSVRYGVVLKELGCRSEARDTLLLSLSLQPLFWGAWFELAALCEDRDMVSSEKDYSLPHQSFFSSLGVATL